MARKVFISFLGTSPYKAACYKFGTGKTMPPSCFIQESLLDHIATDWSADDKVLIFLTPNARKMNWDRADGGLWPILQQKNYAGIVEDVDISEVDENTPEGTYENGIWSIFETVYSMLDNDDEVYFDVTHAFRYIPMFAVSLLNFSQFMKNTNLKAIYYGAFEVLGNPRDIDAKYPDPKDRIAPVVDMTSIVRLQQYTDIASDLKQFGKLKTINESLMDNSDESKHVKSLIKNLKLFDESIAKCDLRRLRNGEIIKEIGDNIAGCRCEGRLHEPMLLILKETEALLKDFVPYLSYQNVEAAIAWARKYDMIQQAYTMAEEYVTSVLSELFQDHNPYPKRDKKRDEHYRSYLNQICSIADYKWNSPGRTEVKNDLAKYIALTEAIMDRPIVQELRKAEYGKFSGNRNQLNHADGQCAFATYVAKFDEIYPKCLAVLKRYIIES